MPAHLLTPERVRTIVTVPNVAIPTVCLAVCCAIGTIAVIAALHSGSLSPTTCVALNAFIIYASFTPLHDATHSSVAKTQFRWVNDAVGALCGCLLFFPYFAFRYLHLQHHQHTNDVEKDPDYYTARGPWYVLPFRWMTIEYHHYSCYLCSDVFFKRSMSERMLAVGQILFHFALAGYFIQRGHASTVLLGWVLPGRIAVFFLALLFDYLPHRPHSHTRKESEYLATSLTALWPSKSSVSLLTWPLFHQNYHNIHHLVPYIPFYMYETVWLQCKDELEKQGTQTIPIIGTMKKLD